MPVVSSISIQGTIEDGPAGDITVGPITTTGVAWASQAQILASGFNTITVPQLPVPVGVIIIPPSTNTQTVILKGITGDTGIRLHKTKPHLLTFDSTAVPATFGLTAGANIADPFLFQYF